MAKLFIHGFIDTADGENMPGTLETGDHALRDGAVAAQTRALKFSCDEASPPITAASVTVGRKNEIGSVTYTAVKPVDTEGYCPVRTDGRIFSWILTINSFISFNLWNLIWHPTGDRLSK